MYEELELLETDSVLPAYNAVCDIVEEVERLQAACAAKEVELAELRAQTAELFGARLDAEGMSEEAVTAAKAMWQHDPHSAAMAMLGCDIVEAANPYGCNQYGHEWKGKHGEGWKPSGRGRASDKKEDTYPKEKSIEEEAKEHFEATPEQRQVIMQRWKKEVYNAKEAYERYKDYRKEGQEEYQKEKARLKAELDKAIERFKEKIIESAKMRGWPLRQGQSVANTFLAQIL